MLRPLRTLRSIPRLKDIAFVLGRHGFHQVAGSLHAPLTTRLRRLFKREPRHVIQQPERLRMVLEELGPTFIKFGQLLATRPDLLPPVYMRELEKLQDDVPPAPFEEIRSTIEAELGGWLDKRFRHIDPEPLAAASIAQVHRAVTVDGQQVVLKVRKRGLERVIEQDLVVLGLLTDFLSGWPGLRLFDPEGILRVFERTIRRELNFDYERHNLERLRRNLPVETRIHYPRSFPALSTSGVLTMEYLPGAKLSSFQRRPMPVDEGERAGRDLASCFLQQIFEDGFFHADPHPGNVILTEDGRVGLIDVGNVGRLTREMVDELVVLLVALVHKDYRGLARWILRQGKPTREVDGQTLAMDLMDQLDPCYGLSLEEIRIGELLNALFGMVLRYGIRVPPQYVSVGRTFVIVESVVRICAPGIDLLPYVEPHVTRILRRRWAPRRLVREAESQVTELLAAFKTLPSNFAEVLERAAEGRLEMETRNRDLERVENKLEFIANRIPLAIVTAAVILGSTALLCVPHSPESSLPEILGISGLVVAFLLGGRLLLR